MSAPSPPPADATAASRHDIALAARSEAVSQLRCELLRRWTISAAALDVCRFLLLLWLGLNSLAALAVLAFVSFGVAHQCAARRRPRLAASAVTVALALPAIVGCFLLGWESGYHYSLWLLVPLLTHQRAVASALTMLLLVAIYLGLHALTPLAASTTAVSTHSLLAIHALNAGTGLALAGLWAFLAGKR